ncbi:MAG TPA: GDSL-type esterase/lipase family protein [Verrucomicrobiae bacterium]|jgi:lysophospholipase L1-like esterase
MNFKKIALLLFVLVAVWALWQWLGRDHYLNYPPSARGPWVAFGDSLTEGYGATEGQDYPSVLSKKLEVLIRNLGRSGENSADGMKRVDEVAGLHPRVVLLCFGGNDALNGDSAGKMFANISSIIDRLQREGCFVVLIGIRSASLRDHYADKFKKLAHDKQVLYVPDLLSGLAFKPIYMSDAVHPNDMGYKRFAERVAKALKPYLPELVMADKNPAQSKSASVDR